MTFTSDIPPPVRRKSTRMRLIRELLNDKNIGDSVFIHGLSSSAAHGYAFYIAKESGRISTLTEGSGVRVWKIK